MAVLHQERTLELNADSTEWCPTQGSRDLLAVGTYQLDEATSSRNGRLALPLHRGTPQPMTGAAPAVFREKQDYVAATEEAMKYITSH